jgi:hypothetical protein
VFHDEILPHFSFSDSTPQRPDSFHPAAWMLLMAAGLS